MINFRYCNIIYKYKILIKMAELDKKLNILDIMKMLREFGFKFESDCHRMNLMDSDVESKLFIINWFLDNRGRK